MTMTAAALLSSCGLYKSYERPADIQTDGLYRSENVQGGDSLGLAALGWKEVFTDPKLQVLIERGLSQNTNMLSAQLQIEQAEATLKAAKWAYIPSLALAPQGTLAGVDWGKATQTYTIPATASWQLDLFGSLHNAKKRAKAQLANSEAFRQAVQSQLIAAIALTLTLMTVGDRLLLYAVEHFGLPRFWAALWARLRFPVAGAAGYFALFFLYALSQDGRQPWRNIWPGTMAALGAWLLLNWLYASYVQNFADYSLLYGSIGTAIALLIWLYMTAVTLIMGAEFNATLISLRKDRAGES